MRKWTYLVAALLMSGATATFTSCIDNDEPYGIEQMRTAKAEFYSAQAAYKKAEIDYKNALTQLKLQEVEAARLANDLLSAQNEAEKQKIQAALDLALKEYETKMAVAEEAYQTALKNLDVTISKLNAEYTTAYSRILERITANRAEYKLTNVKLMETQLDLKKYSENTLDTASVRGGYELQIAIHEKNIERYTKELEMLESLSGANATANQETAAKLEEEIRNQVEEYNKIVAELSTLKADHTNKNNELTALKTELGAANMSLYKADAELSLTVGKDIQHDFVTMLDEIRTAGSGNTWIGVNLASLDPNKFNTENLTPYATTAANYYTLVDGFDKVITETDLTAASITIDASSNTTSYMSTQVVNPIWSKVNSKIGTLLGSTSNFDQDYAAFVAQKGAKETFRDAKAKDYNAALEAYTLLREACVKALDAYMYNATQNWFEAVEAYYDKIADPDGMGIPQLTPTDAQLEKLVELLTSYAEKRFALDGFVHKSGTPEAETYKSLKKENVMSQYANVLGSSTLLTNNESAYAKAYNASVELYGGTSIEYGTPDVVAEYKYNKATSATSNRYGGLFGEYIDAYAAVQKIVELDEFVKLSDDLTAIKNDLLVKTIEFAGHAAAINNDEKVVALNDELKALEKQIKADYVQIITTTYTDVSSITVPGKVTVQRVSSTTSGTTTTYTLGQIQFFVSAATPDATLAGYLGVHLNNLKGYFNNIEGQNTNYATQVDNMKKLLNQEQASLATQKQLLAQFKAGGYELNPALSNSIVIGDSVGSYKAVTITTKKTGGSGTIIIEYYYPGESDPHQVETIVEGSPLYDSIVAATSGEWIDGSGTYNIKPAYLQAVIEAYKARVEVLQLQLDDLTAEFELLQKEQADFLEKVNAHYAQ